MLKAPCGLHLSYAFEINALLQKTQSHLLKEKHMNNTIMYNTQRSNGKCYY